MCYVCFLMKILGHQKGGGPDQVLDHEGLDIDVLDLDPGIDADILLDLDPKKDGIEKKKENADRKAFLKSNQKLLVCVALHFGWDSWTKGLPNRTSPVYWKSLVQLNQLI